MMDASPTAEELLRSEAGGLAVDDILALCYALQQRQQPARLRLYMDVLRRRGGERAQFASALICFDLARQGDGTAQREFVFLVDVMRDIALKGDIAEQLVGGDRYLSYVWELCRAHLDDVDLRFAAAEAPAAPVAQVDLLSDADLQGELPDLRVDDEAMRERFETALEAFLGGAPGLPVIDADAGFRLRSSADAQRIEAFLQELDSLQDFVRVSRGYRALALLFYGTHMRSRSLFGVVNRRKQDLLRAGLTEFVASGHILPEVVGVLSPLHAEPEVWARVADVLHDYLAFCAAEPEAARAGPEAYDAVGRLIARDQVRVRSRR